jgi:hypothetical protein
LSKARCRIFVHCVLWAARKFEVGGLRYEYSDFELKAAHITTTVHAGPIEDGLFVRVAYVRDKILRLEIRK